MSKSNKIVFEILRTLLAVLISFAFATIIIFIASDSPGYTLKVFVTAPFSSAYSFGKILTEATPLLFTGVAVCIMVKGGQFNMIGEGTFYAGGLFGAIFAIKLNLPGLLLPLIAILMAGIVSGAIGYVPAKMKASLKINEFVSSLMLNFIIYWVCMYLLANVFIDPQYSDIATKQIPDAGRLPYLSFENQVSTSFIIGLVIVAIGTILLYKTKWGYQIRMTGSNENFANYSGINTKKSIVLSQVIGAAIAGIGGASFILGNYYRFNWKQLPNYGFDGFIIAIIARNNPLLVPFAALFIGYLRSGASEIALRTDVANEIVFIIQAIIMIIVGADAFLSGLRQKKLAQALASKELN